LLPSGSHADIPGGFVKMIIFGSIALFLLVVNIILYFFYKPLDFVWKIPFAIFVIMLLLGWFYNK